MAFLNLCSNSLILSVAFTLLISGLIVFLMNTKISRVEKNIQKQNQALSDMINHIKADINIMGSLPPSGMMMQQHEQQMRDISGVEKIQVSSDSESESDDSDDSETESDEDTLERSSQSREISVNNADTQKTINLSSMSEISQNDTSNETAVAIEKLPAIEVESESSSSDDDDDDSSDDDDNNNDNNSINTIKLQEVLDKVSSDGVEEIIVNKVDAEGQDKVSSTTKPVGLTKLKVTELKDLALNGNLASPDKVADMKKKELIELLRSQ